MDRMYKAAERVEVRDTHGAVMRVEHLVPYSGRGCDWYRTREGVLPAYVCRHTGAVFVTAPGNPTPDLGSQPHKEQ